MSDCTRRNEADELRDQLNNRLEYIAVLEAKCKDLTEELRIANLAIEHSRHVVYYRDGMIAGLKYAIRRNAAARWGNDKAN